MSPVRAPSLASQLLQEMRRSQKIYCRSWLASEGARTGNNNQRGIYPNCQRRGIFNDNSPSAAASKPLANNALSPK
jgi:hypothetical protein